MVWCISETGFVQIQPNQKFDVRKVREKPTKRTNERKHTHAEGQRNVRSTKLNALDVASSIFLGQNGDVLRSEIRFCSIVYSCVFMLQFAFISSMAVC